MQAIIRFFATRHLLVNLITVLILIGGILSWHATNKEELPDITFNTVRISTSYSGASAEDVEFYVTKPIEEAIQGIDHIYRITSSSGQGQSSISVELDRTVNDIDSIVTEIQNQVNSVSLPAEVLDDPRVRIFETSKKAIIDMAIYNDNHALLDVQSRLQLQELARALEDKLLARPEIFSVNRSGYLDEEIDIKANPERFTFYEVPLNKIAQEIRRHHVRSPAGTLKSGQNEQVTILSELDTKAKLDNLVVQGGFDSTPIKLGAITRISDGFEDQVSIEKVNGREAIMFNIVKNSGYGILEALDVVKEVSAAFEKNTLKGTSVSLAFLDDESIDIRNRLSIIASNGLLGFVLIVVTLLIFLNKRSGFWVALGIPFTLCFTLLAGHLLGYSINGITLAGIIIVLGIVVDDAIIVAENISRRINEGESLTDAAVNGTREVVAPITASILTTCAAFIPLLFFSGRYGEFVKFIPPMIFLMLLASVLESFFLLPSHMCLFPKQKSGQVTPARAWFQRWESAYESLLNRLLVYRYRIIALFCLLMIATGFLVKQEFQFVMFPDEESREIVLSGEVSTAKSATETSEAIQPIEDFLRGYIGKEGVAIQSDIARGRRGDTAVENQFRITLEIVAADKRKKSTDDLIGEIKAIADNTPNLTNLRFRKNRFGQSSGSVFEMVVQENDDFKREELVTQVMGALNKHPDIANAEADVIPLRKEYRLNFNQEQLKRLAISPDTISETLRIVLNGRRLYTLFRNDEEVHVNLTVEDTLRDDINQVLSIPIENNQGYLVPLRDVVTVQEVEAKNTIRRQNQKRTSYIYADLAPKTERSPLDIADELETKIFPTILGQFPSAQIDFTGEIIDTRESKNDLLKAIMAVIALIYIVLVLLFDSLSKPLRIMLVIPFGIIGVILAFYAHQKTMFGFYAAVGTLGMLGVVVNDAIVMLNKLDQQAPNTPKRDVSFTASIAKTRLRAIILTTLTTVAGVMPTAYGFGGTDTMLSDMMIALAWGLLFGTIITLVLTPCAYLIEQDVKDYMHKIKQKLPWKTGLTAMVVLGLSLPVHASEQILNLDEFITKAAKNDTTFHGILVQQWALAYAHPLAVEVPERFLSITSGFEIDSDNFLNDTGIQLSQTLPQLGQSYSLQYTYDRSISDDKTAFTFSQSIARNAFGKSVALDGKIQTLKTEIAEHQLIEAYEDYMAQLMTLYYEWMRQHESLQLAKSSYRENEKVLKSILSRQQQKIADETDVNKLKLQLLAKEEQVIRFEREYRETTNQIRRAVQLPPSANVQPYTTIRLDNLPPSVTEELTHIRTQSRSFIMLDKLVKQTQFETQRAAQDLLPSIQLSASVINQSETSGRIGTSIDLPLTNKRAKAVYETTKIDAQKSQLDTITDQDKLLTAIRNLYVSLETQKQLIDVAAQKRQLAERILTKESENYSFGRINLNDYIDAVNRFDTTRFDEIDRQITYQQFMVEWKRLSDQLINRLPDHRVTSL